MREQRKGSHIKQRIIFFLLLCSILLSFLAISAEASTVASGTCGDNITWMLDDAGTLTISGRGEMSNYSLFSSAPWYYQRSSIKNIFINNGITSIGNYAFSYCSNLTSVFISGSITSIDSYAFYECGNLTSITIPDSVTSIGSYAFSGCSGLTSITIPNSVISIGYETFYRCSCLTDIIVSSGNDKYSSLNGVLFDKNQTSLICYPVGKTDNVYTVPNRVINIGNYAFSGCSGLTSITIPGSVTSIGECTFNGCSGLNSITIPVSVASIGKYTFNGCSSLTSVTIPDSVTSIGDSAFDGCSSLTSVTIPDSVVSIGREAFYGCSSLTSITIPNSVISIGDYAFRYCSSLTGATIGYGITRINDCVFDGCCNLTSVTIPNSVTSIGNSAFSECTNLKSVLFYGSQAQWNVISIEVNNNYLTRAAIKYINGDYNLTWTLDDEGTLTISGTGAMVNYTFSSRAPWGTDPYRLKIKTVIIDDGVTSIGNHAFDQCYNLTSVTIPDRVIRIGVEAFYACKNLTSINIPNSVINIGSYAFSGCSSLSIFTIPNSVISIGAYAFNYCIGMTNITVSSGNDQYSSVNGVLFDKNQTSLICYPAGKKDTSYSIPSSVINIDQNAFRNCFGLTSITIPNSVISIGSSAFSNCSSLTSVTIPDSVTSIGSYAFSGCSELKTAGPIGGGYDYEFGWTNTIPSFAFYECSSLISVTIPDSVTSIGSSAFSNCSNLEYIYYSGTVEQWNTIGIANGNEPLLAANILYTSVKSINLTLTNNPIYEGLTTSVNAIVTTIDNQNYENNFVTFSSSNINIATVDQQGNIQTFEPGTVTITATAANGVTANCSLTVKAIQKILSLPTNLGEIESEAFAGLTAVEAVRIPSNVYYIADDTFTGSDVIILAPEGSYAANWALNHGMIVIEE